jgi:hypothetical protein
MALRLLFPEQDQHNEQDVCTRRAQRACPKACNLKPEACLLKPRSPKPEPEPEPGAFNSLADAEVDTDDLRPAVDLQTWN